MNEDSNDIDEVRRLLGLEATTEAEAIHADRAHDRNPQWRCLPPEEPSDDTGDDQPKEPARQRRSELRGYTVETFGRLGPLRDCVVCGGPVTNPADEWVCEFSGDVAKRPKFGHSECRCNACLWNTNVRSRGRPKEVCSSECQRERQRRERAAERRRRNDRHRELAAPWIVDYPEMTDQDIATELGIRPKRVREARELAGVCR